jgi:galactosamine-6-phosphate isomerase
MTGNTDAKPAAGPSFVLVPDAETMSQRAAALIASEVRRRPDLLLCAAAGASPARAYALLARAAQGDPALFRQLRVIKVDEWGGLAMTDPATCEMDLQNRLLRPLGVTADRYQRFDSQAPDPAAECARIAQWLARHGPIDLCVLGIGLNGHIAMNEPTDGLPSGPHVAQLAPSSLQHPMLAASGAKPAYGLTLGMRDILQSGKILLLAAGDRKRPVLERLRHPLLTPRFPASFLWLHRDVTVLWAAAD